MTDKQQLKLEVGKKYNFLEDFYIDNCWGNAHQPCIFIYDNECDFIFLDARNTPFSVRRSWLKNIKEHREPFKEVYEETVSNNTISINSVLCKFHEKILKLFRVSMKDKKLRITIEEMPEQE